jgi:hypothetical protein
MEAPGLPAPSPAAMNAVRLEPERQISALFRVDSRNFADVLLGFTFAVVGFVVTFVLVSAGRPEKCIEDKLFHAFPDRQFRFGSSVRGLSCLNLYVTVYATFKRSSSDSPPYQRVNLSVQIHTPSPQSRDPVLIHESQALRTITFEGDGDDSIPVHIFFDRLVFRSAYHASISATGELLDSLSGLEVVWKSGDTTTAWISICLRLTCLLLAFSISFVYTRLLKSCPFSGWAFEQKLTLVLSVCCLLSNFPLAGLCTSHRFTVYAVPCAICSSIFRAFLVFYIIRLFESISCRNRHKLSITVGLGLGCCLLCAADAWPAVRAVLEAAATQQPGDSHFSSAYRLAVAILPDAMVSAGIVRAYLIMDETEMFRFAVYTMEWFL